MSHPIIAAIVLFCAALLLAKVAAMFGATRNQILGWLLFALIAAPGLLLTFKGCS